MKGGSATSINCPAEVVETEDAAVATVAGREMGEVAVAVAANYDQTQWRLDQRIVVGTRIQTCAALTALPGDPDWWVELTGVGGIIKAARINVGWVGKHKQ